ncbi:hypothetical protein LF817_09530 [Halobacillus sp. A1]|uniref:hypothetical protein n=1 Tax=Halobacillus sp. A1 TaxID=2880262 RepID=UPI0020A6B138|nr:hypothetical protein [Halobacillus sp. A1]MCP3031590.1 hypothetical protein [Halobacillus sp. A1]
MKGIKNAWEDDKGRIGIIEVEEKVFGSTFHPVVWKDEKRNYHVINNLWYTTYHGAREFFRAPTNRFAVEGRMKKIVVESEECYAVADGTL